MQRLLALAAVPWIGVFNLSVSGGYAYGLPGRGHYGTFGGGLDLLFPLTRMHDWELSVGARVLSLAPADPTERAAFMFGVRTGLQFRYRPWRFGFQLGGYAEAGGINVPDAGGGDRTHAYLGGGLTGGLNIPLGRQTALQRSLHRRARPSPRFGTARRQLRSRAPRPKAAAEALRPSSA